MFFNFKVLALAGYAAWAASAYGAEKASEGEIEKLRREGHTITQVTPIFSQLVVRSFPKGFKPVFEDLTQNGSFFIHEFVPEGESAEIWTEMLTDTGMKDMASNPQASPRALAFAMADGFEKACPSSFKLLDLGAIELGDYDAFVVVASCGTAPAANHPHSETALIITIKGEKDYYTVQWAQRGPASKLPLTLDRSIWDDRLKKLQPIKLCSVTQGEGPPYPSCVGN
ncbi:hypothetical protein [Methylocapsa acidiphila]|uniref:hypothetical protein n=1 Tax=Methylocapsa acidiphila TaxID=133552 RepID=UPI0004042A16|nr:hypothetical protein [Methylocapsa acidiphila]